MSDPASAPVTGVCADCGARFRIPDASRTYPCKKCGGEVSAPELLDVLEELVECEACGADNEPDAQYCDECGEPLSASARKAKEHDRRSASSDLRLARKRVGQLKGLFRLFGILALIGAIFLLTAALHAGDRGLELEGEQLDGSVLWLLFVLQSAVATILLVASVRIERKPFFWTLVVAALQTVNVAVGVLAGVPNVLSIILAIVYWSGVAAVAPVERLIEEHPDLAGARRFRGEIKKREGTVRSRPRERSDWGPRLIAIGGVATLLVVLGVGYKLSQRRADVSDRIDAFLDDWRGEGLTGLAEYYEPKEREAMQAAFGEAVELRGWTTGAPKPGAEVGRDVRGEGAVSVRHSFDGDEVVSHWQYDLREKEWFLRRLDLPVGDFVDRVIEAWNSGDPDRIAAFFRDERRGAAAVSSLARRHGWDPLPRIEDPNVEETSSSTYRVTFETEGGPAQLTVRRGSERWYVTRVKPPKAEDE